MGTWLAARPTVWEPEWYKNSQTITHKQWCTDKGLSGYLSRGREGHVELGTNVILKSVQASNNVWEIGLSTSCNSELTVHTKKCDGGDKLSGSRLFIYLNIPVTNRHSHRWGGDWVTSRLTASSPAQEAAPLPLPWAPAPHSLPCVLLVRQKIDGGLILGSQFWSLKK